MRRALNWQAGLAALTLIRLFIASVTPLAPDEAYYWVWSRALAPGYLDHPPMVALWIWIGTALAGPGELGVRLLGPLSGAVGSWLLHDAAERLFPGQRAGSASVILINATLLVSAGSILMTPDTPLLFFWTCAFWATARLVAGGAAAWWLAIGAFTGLALVSKYTAAFLPLGLGLFVAISAPRWWRRPEPWLAGLLAGLILLPVVVWNAQHGWVGFFRQGGRIFDRRPEQTLSFLAELFGGQIGLATPAIFILLVAGVSVAVRETVRTRDPAWCLLASLTLPPVLMFLQHSIGDRVQSNWPAVIYPAASVAAAVLTAPVWRRLVLPSAGLGFGLAVLLYAHVLSAWPSFSAEVDPVARNLFGWRDLAAAAENARRQAGAAFIAVEPYGIASELTRVLPPGIEVIGAGPHWTTTSLPRGATGETLGILVRPEAYGGPDPADWRDGTPLPGIVRTNGDVVLQRYSVFLVRAVEGPFRGVILPRP